MPNQMTHRRAVATMLIVTLLWSMAGVVSRHLESARPFEVTFWRSAFNGVSLLVGLAWWRSPASLWASLRHGGALLWWSGLCWTVMFTAFMVALTLTTVANVLVTMALGPVFTALIARFLLGHRLPARTWAAIVVAGLGIAWMYGAQMAAGDSRHWLGTLVALSVPCAASSMWALLQHNAHGPAVSVESPGSQSKHAPQDMMPAVLIGALGSAALTLPLAWPLSASAHDVGLLGFLGVFQLAVPCLLAVAAGRVLKAPEAALLGLLEIVFGVAWTWLGGGESPTPAVLGGGLLVLLALAANEAWALRPGR